MGFFKSLTSNGGAPAFPPSHTPGEAVNTELPPEAKSQASSQPAPPPGWFIQWSVSHRKIYYLEQETGRTQWVCPNMKNAPPIIQSCYDRTHDQMPLNEQCLRVWKCEKHADNTWIMCSYHVHVHVLVNHKNTAAWFR